MQRDVASKATFAAQTFLSTTIYFSEEKAVDWAEELCWSYLNHNALRWRAKNTGWCSIYSDSSPVASSACGLGQEPASDSLSVIRCQDFPDFFECLAFMFPGWGGHVGWMVKSAPESLQQWSIEARCLALPAGQLPPGKCWQVFIAEFVQNHSFCKLKYLFQACLCDEDMSHRFSSVLLWAQLRTAHGPDTFVWERPVDVFAVLQFWSHFVSLPAHEFQLW